MPTKKSVKNNDNRVFQAPYMIYQATANQQDGGRITQNIIMEPTPTKDSANAPYFSVDLPPVKGEEKPKSVMTVHKDKKGKLTATLVFDRHGNPPSITEEMAEVLRKASERIVTNQNTGRTEFEITADECSFNCSDANGNDFAFSCTIGGQKVKIEARAGSLTIKADGEDAATMELNSPEGTASKVGFGFTLSQELLKDLLQSNPSTKLTYNSGKSKPTPINKLPAPIFRALGAFNAIDCTDARQTAPSSATIGDYEFFGLDAVDGMDSSGSNENNSVLFVKTGGQTYVYDGSGYHEINPGGADFFIGRTPSTPPNDLNFFISYKIGTRRVDLPIRLKTKDGKADLYDPNTECFIALLKFLRPTEEDAFDDWDGNPKKIGGISIKNDANRPNTTSNSEKISHRPNPGSSKNLKTVGVALAVESPIIEEQEEPEEQYIGPSSESFAGERLENNININVHLLNPNGTPVQKEGRNEVYNTTFSFVPEENDADAGLFTILTADKQPLAEASAKVKKSNSGNVTTTVTLYEDQLPADIISILNKAGYVAENGKFTLSQAQVRLTTTGTQIESNTGDNKVQLNIGTKGINAAYGGIPATETEFTPTETASSQLPEDKCYATQVKLAALSHPTTQFVFNKGKLLTTFSADTKASVLPVEVLHAIATAGCDGEPPKPIVKQVGENLTFFAGKAPGYTNANGDKVASNVVMVYDKSEKAFRQIIINGKLVKFKAENVKVSYEGDGKTTANLNHSIITIVDEKGKSHTIPVETPVKVDPNTGKITYENSEGFQFLEKFYVYVNNPSTLQEGIDGLVSENNLSVGNPLKMERGDAGKEGKVKNPNATLYVDGVFFAGPATCKKATVIDTKDPAIDDTVTREIKPVYSVENFEDSIKMSVTTQTPKGDAVVDKDGNPMEFQTETKILSNSSDPDLLFSVAANGRGNPIIKVTQQNGVNGGGPVNVVLNVSELPKATQNQLKTYFDAYLKTGDDKLTISNSQIAFTESGMSIVAEDPNGNGKITLEVNPRGVIVTTHKRNAEDQPFKTVQTVALPGGPETPVGAGKSTESFNISIYEQAFNNSNCTFQYVNPETNKLEEFKGPTYSEKTKKLLKNGTAFTHLPPVVAYGLAAQAVNERGQAASPYRWRGIEFMAARLPGYATSDGHGVASNVMLVRDGNDNNKRYLLNDGKFVELDGDAEYFYDSEDTTRMYAQVRDKEGHTYQILLQQKPAAENGKLDTGFVGAKNFDTIASMLHNASPKAPTPPTLQSGIIEKKDDALKIGTAEFKPGTFDPALVPKNKQPAPPKVENVVDYGAAPVTGKKRHEAEIEEEKDKRDAASIKPLMKTNPDAVKAAQLAGGAAAAIGAVLFLLSLFVPGAGLVLSTLGLSLVTAGGLVGFGTPMVAGLLDSVDVGGPFGKIAKARRAVSKREKAAQKYLAAENSIAHYKELADEFYAKGRSKAAEKCLKKARKLERNQNEALALGGGKLLTTITNQERKAAGQKAREEYKKDHPEATEAELTQAEENGKKGFMLEFTDKDANGRWNISPETYTLARGIIASLDDKNTIKFLMSLTPTEREIIGQAIGDIRDAACALMMTEDGKLKDFDFEQDGYKLSSKQIRERLGDVATDTILERRYKHRGHDNKTGHYEDGPDSVELLMDNIFGARKGYSRKQKFGGDKEKDRGKPFDWAKDAWQTSDTDEKNDEKVKSLTKNIEALIGNPEDGESNFFEQMDHLYYAKEDVEELMAQLDSSGVVTILKENGEVVTMTKEKLEAALAQIGFEQADIIKLLTTDNEAVRKAQWNEMRDKHDQRVIDALNNPNSLRGRIARHFDMQPRDSATADRYRAEKQAASFGKGEENPDKTMSQEAFEEIAEIHNDKKGKPPIKNRGNAADANIADPNPQSSATPPDLSVR